MNTKKVILEFIKEVDEEIIAIQIGRKGDDYNSNEEGRLFRKKDINKALDILDFEFDSGYGGEEGYSIYVWTKNWIILKGTYDGSESYHKIPRKPVKSPKADSIGG